MVLVDLFLAKMSSPRGSFEEHRSPFLSSGGAARSRSALNMLRSSSGAKIPAPAFDTKGQPPGVVNSEGETSEFFSSGIGAVFSSRTPSILEVFPAQAKHL